MNHTDIAARTAAYLNTFLEKEGFELLKTEYVKEDGNRYLRAYIDLTDAEREKRKQKLAEEEKEREESPAEADQDEATAEDSGPDGNGGGLPEEEPAEPGIGINDCALVSRRLSKWLDKEDFIPEEYMLEVCSRGYLNG